MIERRATSPEAYLASALLNDGVVTVDDELFAHAFGVATGGEGTNLDVNELVLRLVAFGDRVAFGAKSADEEIGVIFA